MASDNIDQLLEQYLNGNTTLEQEALLKHYFTSDKVASHHNMYQPLFQYFSTQQAVNKAPLPRLKTQTSKRLWYSGIVAATLALFIGFYGWQEYQHRQYAKQIYRDSQDALALIGKYLNKGNEAIYQLNHLEKSSDVVFRSNQN